MQRLRKTAAKRLKQKWRESRLRNVLRGFMGPSRKTIARAVGVISKEAKQEESYAAAKGLVEFVEQLTGSKKPFDNAEKVFQERREENTRTAVRKMVRATTRMSAKYAMDALNIRNPEKRKKVFELVGITAERAVNAYLNGRDDIAPVFKKAFQEGLEKELGAKTVLFHRLFRKKSDRILSLIGM